MKTMKYLMGLLGALVLASCAGEKVSDPVFGPDETPYIYMEWSSSQVYSVGDVVKFTAQVSPLEGTSVRWLIDGNVVSTTPSIEYTIEGTEGFTLRFEAERNGIVNYRQATVAIQVPFVPKNPAHKVMGVITTDGNADMVQWDYISHLLITSFQVTDAGKLALPDDGKLATLKTLVSLAHNKGVYVQADVTGIINMPAGSGLYNSMVFQTVVADDALRASLVADIKKLVADLDLDGVNIYVNELNCDAGAIQEKDAIVQFIKDLRAAFPAVREGERLKYLVTASVPRAWNSYEFYFLGQAEAELDWINLLLFGALDLTPCDFAPDWYVNDFYANFLNAAGFPYSKQMVGVGAFGIHYQYPDGVAITWGNQDQYLGWPTYSEILKMDASASSNCFLNLGSGLYYTGATGTNSATSKALIVKDTPESAGMFIWCVDYDSTSAQTSLTQAVWNTLNL